MAHVRRGRHREPNPEIRTISCSRWVLHVTSRTGSTCSRCVRAYLYCCVGTREHVDTRRGGREKEREREGRKDGGDEEEMKGEGEGRKKREWERNGRRSFGCRGSRKLQLQLRATARPVIERQHRATVAATKRKSCQVKYRQTGGIRAGNTWRRDEDERRRNRVGIYRVLVRWDARIMHRVLQRRFIWGYFFSLSFSSSFSFPRWGISFHVDGDFLVCPVWEEDDLFRSVTRFGGIGIFEDVEK